MSFYKTIAMDFAIVTFKQQLYHDIFYLPSVNNLRLFDKIVPMKIGLRILSVGTGLLILPMKIGLLILPMKIGLLILPVETRLLILPWV